MTAPVLPLRLRRTTSDPLARLLDLETEVEAQIALFRRVGARLQELEAERKQIEGELLTETEVCDLIELGCALEGAPCLSQSPSGDVHSTTGGR